MQSNARNAEELFAAVCDLPPEAQRAELERLCGDDAGLRADVESLLRADSSAGGFLESPAVAGITDALRSTEGPAARGIAPGVRLDGFRVLEQIAAGGMGVVYKAEQDHPRRLVALKIAKSSGLSDQAIRRLRHESNLLGRLSHPNIAQIYEASNCHIDGLETPYFAMEFVPDARHIDACVRAAALPLRSRLALFLRVCDAVHHGHQRGVIHRDLKPSNILVNGDGHVKVIDFGVAWLTDFDVTRTTDHAELSKLVGTLQYISPEQCGDDPLDLDTRSDVYALGVVLYELLCERPPYELAGRPLAAAIRVLQNEPPVRPATVNPRLRGDLETIILKSLEKDRTRRYASASELGADLQRFLNSEPIAARPPSAIYQLRKLAARHRPLALGAAVGIVGLALGLGLAIWQAVAASQEADRAREAERRAKIAAATAERVVQFQQGMFAAAEPKNAGEDVTVREVLDDASAHAAASLGDAPEVEGTIRDSLGQSYLSLGRLDEAEREFARALQLRRATLGDADPLTLNTMNNLAVLFMDQGRFSDAEPLLRDTWEVQRATLGDGHADTIGTSINLGAALFYQRKLDEAVEVIEQALADASAELGEESPQALTALNTLAVIHGNRGDYEAAAPLLASSYEINARLNGPEHPSTLTAMHNLARLYEQLERWDEAEDLSRRSTALRAEVLGPDHPATLNAQRNLANLLAEREQTKEAEAILRAVVEQSASVLGTTHPATLRARGALARVLMMTDRAEAALPLLRSVYAHAVDADNNQMDVARAAGRLGQCLQRLEEYADAEPLLLDRYETYAELLGADDASTRAAADDLAALHEAWGRENDAAAWRARADGGQESAPNAVSAPE